MKIDQRWQRTIWGVFLCTGILLSASTGKAVILGQVYEDQPETSNSGLISTIPATAPDAEFNTNNIQYSSSTGYTIGSFLLNPTFFNTSVSFNPSNGLDDTLIVFTGQTYLNAGPNSFITPHDDGFEFSIPGAGFDFQFPGPTSPVNTPYTVTAPASGYYSFELSYFEGWGPPATIGVTINNAPINSNQTPEPATMALFGVGLVGLAGVVRRKKADSLR
jgi:hypothetical protein